jgi:hypothetical protein
MIVYSGQLSSDSIRRLATLSDIPVVLLIHSTHIRREYLKIGHDCLLPHSFQLITPKKPDIPRYTDHVED